MPSPREKQFPRAGRSGRARSIASILKHAPQAAFRRPEFELTPTERRVLAAIAGADTIIGITDADIFDAVARRSTALTQTELVDALALLGEQGLVAPSRLDAKRTVITPQGLEVFRRG